MQSSIHRSIFANTTFCSSSDYKIRQATYSMKAQWAPDLNSTPNLDSYYSHTTTSNSLFNFQTRLYYELSQIWQGSLFNVLSNQQRNKCFCSNGDENLKWILISAHWSNNHQTPAIQARSFGTNTVGLKEFLYAYRPSLSHWIALNLNLIEKVLSLNFFDTHKS